MVLRTATEKAATPAEEAAVAAALAPAAAASALAFDAAKPAKTTVETAEAVFVAPTSKPKHQCCTFIAWPGLAKELTSWQHLQHIDLCIRSSTKDVSAHLGHSYI